MNETPPQLVDALARLDQARENYMSLAHELNEFLYEYVKGMVRGYNEETESFVLRLRHPKESFLSGRPVVLTSQIVENLRTALDYMIFELSVLNEPDLNERGPQFVIAEDESTFISQAKTRLRYLTAEQKDFIEQIQPYRGNKMLALLGELAIQGKHRRLLSLQDVTGLKIVSAEISRQEEYKDYFVYPMGKGHATFAKPMQKPVFLLMERYDVMHLLNSMIAHVGDILRVSYCFFQGRPLHLTILRADQES